MAPVESVPGVPGVMAGVVSGVASVLVVNSEISKLVWQSEAESVCLSIKAGTQSDEPSESLPGTSVTGSSVKTY